MKFYLPSFFRFRVSLLFIMLTFFSAANTTEQEYLYNPLPQTGSFAFQSLACFVQFGTNASVTCNGTPNGYGIAAATYLCSGNYTLRLVSGANAGSLCIGAFSPSSVLPQFQIFTDQRGSIQPISGYFLVGDTNNNCNTAGFTSAGANVTADIFMACNLPFGAALNGPVLGSIPNATTVSNVPLVAAGGYNTSASGGPEVPLVVSSTNGGTTWSFPIYSGNVPSDLSTTSTSGTAFNSTNCSGIFCIAVGQYVNSSGGTSPLIATSTNNGVTWSYTITSSNLPSNAVSASASQNAKFNDTNCSSLVCVAAGTYLNTSGGTSPMIAVSQNGGVSWSYVSSFLNAPSDLPGLSTQKVTIKSASCSGSLCFVAGSYVNTTGGTYPLILVSNNYTQTWSYNLTSSNVPSNAATGASASIYFNVVSCSGTLCAAAGAYKNNSASPNPAISPLIAVSNNNGVSWSYNLTSSNVPSDAATGGSQSFAFYSVGCSGIVCVADGSYTTLPGGSSPAVAVSSNSGITWTYKVTSTTPTPPTDMNISSLGGIQLVTLRGSSCSSNGTLCLVSGYYLNASFGTSPLLLLSTNSGSSWTYQITSATVPSDAGTGANQSVSFYDTSCTGILCLAVGTYGPASSSNYYPLLAFSSNAGSTWTYPIFSTTSPSDIGTSGVLNSSTN